MPPENSLKNLDRRKAVIWNGQIFKSGVELAKKLNVCSSSVTKSINQGTRLKGHYTDHAI